MTGFSPVAPPTIRESVFRARQDGVRDVHRFVEAFCRDTAMARPPSLRLNLVVEELFTNTICHGHRGDSDFPVWIRLESDPVRVLLTYLDQAPPFNPLAWCPREGRQAALSADVERRRVGGLGILLATELTTGGEYTYLFGRNRLRMVVPR